MFLGQAPNLDKFRPPEMKELKLMEQTAGLKLISPRITSLLRSLIGKAVTAVSASYNTILKTLR